jgi:hypothetical protein
MTRRTILAGLALLVAGLVPVSTAQAQVHVDFLFGGGGYGYHHHHHGWYGGYGFYYPRPVYYYPPPPVYVPVPQPVPVAVPSVSSLGVTAPTATQPLQTVASPTSAPSLANTQLNSMPTYQGRGISIRNPTETNTAVTFVVDGRREAALSPGESHSLAEKSSYTIEFDRGGEFGTARQVVNEGSYEFVATDRGWDLRRMDATAAGPTGATVRRNTLPAR